jgi:diguanylate cyclase (GGDEF)-like protein
MPMPISVDPPFRTATSSRAAGRAPELNLMRVRILLVVGATFVIALLAGGVIVAQSVVGFGSHAWLQLIAGPPPAAVALAIAFALAIALVARMTRHIIQPAEDLASSRHDLGVLYESARSHALEDSLTGLANHRAFQEEFESMLALSVRLRMDLALLLVDIDDFKIVNDSAGHAVGDDLLVEMGRILRGQLRASDRAFRIGGDEFAILMPHTDADNAKIVANRLLAACVEPRPAGVFLRGFAFSGGLTAAPFFASGRDTLLNQADEALYRAKRDGRCLIRIFDPATSTATLDIRFLSERSAAVADVLTGGGLRPVYQPIIDLRNGDALAFEGLTRLPDGTPFRDPGVLFRAAEAAGRTYELDLACVTAVLDGARTIDRRTGLSLNLSPRTLEAPEFAPEHFVARLSMAGWEPQRVIIELTERDAVQDIDRLRRVLGRLQAAGLRIAADDVGAGNAGLRLLSQIQFDIVKLDLGLVQEGARRETSLEVVRSLADLAARWGAMVIAEGLETPAQLRLIRSLPIAAAQGYLLGRPATVPDQRSIDLDSLEAGLDVGSLESNAPGIGEFQRRLARRRDLAVPAASRSAASRPA